MQRLTIREVNEQFEGKLPPGATLRSESEEITLQTVLKPMQKGRKVERFEILNSFTDFSLNGLTSSQVKVWLILFRDTKSATGTARTGQSDLARRAGTSPRTIRNARTELKAKGMIKVMRRGRLNDGPSIYKVFPNNSACGNQCPVT